MADSLAIKTFFPEPQLVEFVGLTQTHYVSERSEVVYTPVQQGQAIAAHQHLASQIGMAASGSYRMKCGESEEVIRAFENACNVRPNVLHGAPYKADASYVSLDIKRSAPEGACHGEPGGFVTAETERLFGGFKATVLTGPWFRLLFGTLAAGASLDLDGARHEVIGIPFSGRCRVRIDDAEALRGEREVWFAPPGARLDVTNAREEEARMIVALITV